MPLKPILLLGLILIAFWGCRKNPVQEVQPPKVHEINIGVVQGKINPGTEKVELFFPAFWQFNLLTDSVYLKISPGDRFSSEDTSFRAASYPLRKLPVIKRFIEAAAATPSGKRFLFNDGKLGSGTLYCFPLHVVQYKQDTISKYFFVDADSGTFRDVIDLAREFHFKAAYNHLPVSDIGDKSLAELLVKDSDLKDLPLVVAPPLPVQQTIKFTPPVIKK